MIQFFESCDCVNVFQMVIMVNGQASTIKVIQLLLNIDICSGMSNTERPWLHTDDQLMKEYIARHKDQPPLQDLEELKATIEYGRSDPRLHARHQEHSEDASKEAEKRIQYDFNNLTKVLECYVEDHGVLPYVVVLQCLASRYLGGGMLDPTFIDEEHPYRSSPQFSMMFWHLGNWCRKSFDTCPVPERLQRFTPHIDYNLDGDHDPIGDDKPQFNNCFINVIKNFGGHLFMNCEAGTLYPHRARLEEARITTCFKKCHDLMGAACIGKKGNIRQIAGYNTNENDTRIRYVSWQSSKSSGESPSTETHKRLKI